ncbi:MAG: PilZ domain-containing protein [Terracidiphilus sp.]|nr:PilZ domain-containing protein [Terracidiphilus sp.]
MTTQTHRITNRTKGKLLSEGVHAVDATFEHLTVLRVLIEGLADNNEAGLWLTEVRGIPTVPRISPIDLIYVDEQQRVVEAVELLPAGEQPPFRAPAVSALVLPFQTISATQTRVGDQLTIDGESAEAVPFVPAETVAKEPEPLPAAVINAVASVQPAAERLPAIPMAHGPAPAPPVPLPVLTVHEVVLPDAPETKPAHQDRATGQPRHGKRHKNPHSRKARRQAAVAQRSQDAASVARTRRERQTGKVQAPPEAAAAPKATAFAPVLRQPVPVAARVEPLPEMPLAAQAGARERTLQATVKRAKEGLLSYLRVDLLMDAPTDVKGNERGSAMAIVSRVLRWLNPNAVNEEQRSSIRRPANELVAYTGPEGEEKKLDVGDISSSGMFLRTDQRWEPGSKVSLSLQQNGPVADIPDRHVEVDVNTVRHGKDGIGVEFVLPKGTNLDLWESAVSGQAAQTGPDYIVHEMRIAQALAVLHRICPQVVEAATKMLRKDFSSVRVRDCLRILLLVDKMLPSSPENDQLKAPAELIVRILEMGSWANEEWTQKLWAGLLKTACTPSGDDMSNAQLVDILCQLAHVHIRILELACTRHADTVGGNVDSPTVIMRELTKLLDLSNLTKTLRSVSEMADLGLLTPIKRSASDPQDENAKTTVTPLGLRMFARCHGRREA